MPDENMDDLRREYAAIVRAVAAFVELEASFGIDSAKLPTPPAPARQASKAPLRPQPRSAGRPPAARPTPPPRPTAAARPGPAPRPAAPKAPPEATMHVSMRRAARDMFGPKEYNIHIPDDLSKQEKLDFFAKEIAQCQLCPLAKGRRHVVFGAGDPDADLMFVGEAPGRDEDIQGVPFVGRAGQLLTKIIEAIDMTRQTVYIANIGKCRPPNNRAPLPDEMQACLPFLLRQIDIIQPKIICLLGATAVRGLLDVKTGITKLRGRFIDWDGIRVMPTYHPAYLLRNPAAKRDVWEDMKLVRDTLSAL